MKTRLMLACLLAAHALGGCVTDAPRLSGSLAARTYQEEIGKPLPASLQATDCGLIH